MDKSQVVLIEPDTELRFVQVKGDNTGQLKSVLTISNLSKENLAYKVKTTAPRHYVVKPNQGIIDGLQKIQIEISLIPNNENNVEENKFLVQVAQCQLSQSESYALGKFWDTLDKKLSHNFKLKATVGPIQSSQSAPPPLADKSLLADPQSQAAPAKSKTEVSKKQEYEKAPDEDINKSQTVLQASQMENVKKKTEELQVQYEKITAEKESLRAQIKEIQQQAASGNAGLSEKDQYAWQEPEQKSGFKLLHLLLAALISMFLGHYLAGTQQAIGGLSEGAGSVNVTASEL